MIHRSFIPSRFFTQQELQDLGISQQQAQAPHVVVLCDHEGFTTPSVVESMKEILKVRKGMYT